MAVKEEEIRDISPASSASAPSSHAATPASVEEAHKTLDAAAEGVLKARMDNRKKSVGETIYNRTVYTGIGFGANELFSLLFTGMFERGKNRFLGRERFEQISAWMATKHNFKNGQEGARKLLMWASLNFIGCFVVPAIKITDGYKSRIIKWVNHRFGSKGMSEADIAARDREVEEAVACEPTQSWGTLWLGRLAGMATAIGFGFGVLGKPGNDKLESSFNTGAIWTANHTGLGRFAANRPAPNTPKHEMSRFHYYSQLAGPETLGSGTTSVVLEIASKFFAKHWPRFKDPKIRAEALAKEKDHLITAAAQCAPEHSTLSTSHGIKALAAAKPAVSYAEKIASEPQPTLQQGI